MRWLVLLLALIGVATAGYPGYLFFDAKRKAEAEAKATTSVFGMNLPLDNESEEGKQVEDAKAFVNNFKMLTYGLLGTAVLSLLGGFVALARRGFLATLLLWIGALGSLYFAYNLQGLATKMEMKMPEGGLTIFTLILVCVGAPLLAGLLSLFVRRPADGATA